MNINNYKSNLSLVSILHNIDFKGNKKKIHILTNAHCSEVFECTFEEQFKE